MKILIISDLHGRTFWRRVLNIIDEVDKIIFLGDYLDPYYDENISWEDAVIEFKEILKLKEKYPEKVILLIGNHDCFYMFLNFPDCSRNNYTKRNEINKLFTDNFSKFLLIYEVDNYLFSHAGLYKEWMELCNFTLDDLKNFDASKNWPALSATSFFRGGYHSVGSCVWADIRESVKNELYTDKRQIVGHTQLQKDPYITDKICCLDCRKCFILDTETGEINEY